MEERESDEHDVVEMELEEDVRVQTVEEGLAMRKDGALRLAGGPGGVHDDLGFFRVCRPQGLCEKRPLPLKVHNAAVIVKDVG
jgi:hypothetical protein